MATTKIYTKCPQCGGDSIRSMPDASAQPPIFHEIPCTTCVDGYIEMGEIDLSDMVDKINDIMDKCNDIFEKVSE